MTKTVESEICICGHSRIHHLKGGHCLADLKNCFCLGFDAGNWLEIWDSGAVDFESMENQEAIENEMREESNKRHRRTKKTS